MIRKQTGRKTVAAQMGGRSRGFAVCGEQFAVDLKSGGMRAYVMENKRHQSISHCLIIGDLLVMPHVNIGKDAEN